MCSPTNHQEANTVSLLSGQGRLSNGVCPPMVKSTPSVPEILVKTNKATIDQSGPHEHELLGVDSSLDLTNCRITGKSVVMGNYGSVITILPDITAYRLTTYGPVIW
jgi:hypothetical protein